MRWPLRFQSLIKINSMELSLYGHESDSNVLAVASLDERRNLAVA